MKRGRLFSIAASASLVLCAVTVLIWLRSYWRCDAINWCDGQRFGSITSSGGRINFTYSDWEKKTAWPSRVSFASWQRSANRPHWERIDEPYNRRRFLGFEWTDALYPLSDSKTVVWFHIPTYSLIAVPYWALCLLLALVPLRRSIIACRRQSRRRQGRCPACGYDLRATPDRCPECGTPASAAAANPM